jgi:hypothetical protein
MKMPLDQVSPYDPAPTAPRSSAAPRDAQFTGIGYQPRGPPLAYRIDEFVRISGVGRTSVYAALKSGRLSAIKAGSRTLIIAESAHQYLRSLPAYRPLTSSNTEAA